jgi:hypothetical protein
MIRDSNKIKYNLLFFCLDATNTKNKKMNNAKNEKLKRNTKETKKKKDMTLFRSLTLILTNMNLMITYHANHNQDLDWILKS